jgi:hypothetical protein
MRWSYRLDCRVYGGIHYRFDIEGSTRPQRRASTIAADRRELDPDATDREERLVHNGCPFG